MAAQTLVMPFLRERLSPLEKHILEILAAAKGGMTRPQIIAHVRRPRTTVYDNLRRLIEHGAVRKYSRPPNVRGRPLVFFAITDEFCAEGWRL